MSTPTSTDVIRPTATWAAPIGFLGAFLALGPITGAFADRALPLPGAPAAEVAAYYAANPLATFVSAGMQVVSVACFTVFVACVAPTLRAGRGGARLPVIGYASAGAMVLSSLLATTAALAATAVSADVVDTLRLASFYTGGVANVVALGVFVFAASLVLGRQTVLGKPTRRFGYVAGTLAMLSVLSLGIFYASALLPIGRVLCMAWTVFAGIRLVRAARAD
jgi:hypothetical protein